MLSVACLMKDTDLAEQLRDYVELLAYQRAADYGKASLAGVYADIKKLGFEIDLRSIGYLYADVLPTHEDAFDSLPEIDAVIGEDFRSLTHALINSTPRVRNEVTGKDSPEQWVAAGITRAFYHAHSTAINTTSVMAELQKAMFKGAQRLLGELPRPAKNKEDFEDIIARAFNLQKMGYATVTGEFNGVEDLFRATQKEMRAYEDAIKNDTTMKDADRILLLAQFQEYYKALKTASYSLLLSKTEARKILLDSLKEAGFVKMVGGNRVIDWVKLSGNINSPSAVRDNVEAVLDGLGYPSEVIDGVKAALEQEFYDLHAEILERAATNLISRKARITNVRKPNKTDLAKLAELHSLRLFEGSHTAVLNRALGVDALTVQDMKDVETIGKQVSQLQNEHGGRTIFATYAFHAMQEQINKIVARNISSKTKMLKLVALIDKFFQVKNFGIIANVYNLAENNISGAKELLSTQLSMIRQMGLKQAFKDGALFRDTWIDIAKGGNQYGAVNANFSNRENINRDMEDKSKDKNPIIKYARKSAKLVTAVGRGFLTASDSAYKASIHRKVFQMAVHKALTEHAKMSKEDANLFINEALYGQSLKDAKTQATDILTRYKLDVNPRTITRLANDLVIANLQTGNKISMDMIEAAAKSSYKVAGIGLGHESQTWLANKLSAARREGAREQQEMIKNGQWARLASARMFDIMLYGFAMPFMSGIYNWMALKVQSGFGMGIVSGLFGDFKKDIDFTDRKTIEESMFRIKDSQQKIARGIVGLTYAAIGYSLVLAIAYSDDDDETKEGALSNLFAAMKQNAVFMKMFKKTAPDMMLAHFMVNTGKSWPEAGMNYVMQFFNLGSSYSLGGQAIEALKQFRYGEMDKGFGQVSNMVGGRVEVPLWRAWKGTYIFGEWLSKGALTQKAKEVQIEYKQPDTFLNGVFGGGMLEDIGVYEREVPLTNLPGVGPKTTARLKELGIDNIEEFRKSGWQEFTTEKGRKMFGKKGRAEVETFLQAQEAEAAKK